jgi:UbiD family decarboxylase
LEIGAITEIMAESPDSPALLFDNIEGYPTGYRVLSNFLSTPRKAVLALDSPLDTRPVELTRRWKERIKTIRPIPSREISWRPIMENQFEGQDVDCLRFPTPKWHERDGGRYLGTADLIIQRDPDDPSWINVGTYRVQVQNHDTLTSLLYPVIKR